MTTAEACVEAYLAEQAARPAPTQILRRPDAPAAPSPADNKAAKQRALLQRQVEALFSDEALVALGRQRLAQLRDAGKYCMSLKDLAARSWKGVPRPSAETLREALLASAVVDIVDDVVERSLVSETDLLAQYDTQLRRQVSYLFSDANLQSCPPAKLRAMLDKDEETLFLPLVAVVATKKVKELLRHETDKIEACRAALDAAAPGTMICAVADHAAGPRVVRTQDLSDELWALLESNPAASRTVAVTNLRGKAAPALRLAFAKVGAVETVDLGADERGAPTASITFEKDLGAIRAVEELNDEDNWRFGLRVRLADGRAPAAARKDAGLPPQVKKPEKPSYNERCATEGSSRAAAPPPPPVVHVPVVVEATPEGRQRGKLVYLKEGKFGFIRPRDAKSKDEHAFFAMNELPKNLKLKLGDYLEFTPATGDAKHGTPGKPRACGVTRAPRPNKPTKKQIEILQKDAAEAARVAALAAAALERRNAPPVSKLEALALRVEEGRGAAESVEVDENEARPDRLRSRLRLTRRTTTEDGPAEEAFSDVSRLAKGPDGTPGFARRRTIKPSAFCAEVAEYVPMAPMGNFY